MNEDSAQAKQNWEAVTGHIRMRGEAVSSRSGNQLHRGAIELLVTSLVSTGSFARCDERVVPDVVGRLLGPRHASFDFSLSMAEVEVKEWFQLVERSGWTDASHTLSWRKFLAWHLPLTSLDLLGAATLTGELSEYGALSARAADHATGNELSLDEVCLVLEEWPAEYPLNKASANYLKQVVPSLFQGTTLLR